MGASESTASSNGTIAAAAGAGVAVAWGVCKALSDGTKHKMNVDGACSLIRDRGPGSYGGILRNPRGKFVCGFKGYIEESDTLKSELYAILKGLELLVKLKLTGSILETDSQAAYQFVIGQGECGKSKFVQDCKSIIEKCRKLAGENGISVNHVTRENNQCADKLANMGKKMGIEGYVEFNVLPDELKDLV